MSRHRILTPRWAAGWAATSAIVLLVTGCGRGSESSGYVSGDSVIEQVAVADRKTLPAITGELLGSGTYDSRDYAGRVVVYNVWG